MSHAEPSPSVFLAMKVSLTKVPSGLKHLDAVVDAVDRHIAGRRRKARRSGPGCGTAAPTGASGR
jgi:hypothetical protein